VTENELWCEPLTLFIGPLRILETTICISTATKQQQHPLKFDRQIYTGRIPVGVRPTGRIPVGGVQPTGRIPVGISIS